MKREYYAIHHPAMFQCLELSVAICNDRAYAFFMLENPLILSAVYGAGFYLFLNLFALVISDRLIFRPRKSAYEHLPSEVRIPTSDGETLNAVYLENPAADYTLLFSHGNAEDLSNVLPFMQEYFGNRFSILMYDYRGYGTSDGTPSTRKVKTDASAAYRWLTEEKKVVPKTIIAHGRSLGGALAVWTAAHHNVGGLIVESSFASALRVKTGVHLLPWDKFNSEKLIPNVGCPVLIMHGTKDQVIPFRHAKLLYAAAPEPKTHFWIAGARHMDYAYVAEEHYFNTISEFVDGISEYQGASPESARSGNAF
ncbi:alpha/beta hydrolase [Pontiellaceae bacterium B1224]|nr:alpha/beta hydrolase [Pontiellaceae bacterium B1224]